MSTVAMAPEDEYTLKFFLKPRPETAKGEGTKGRMERHEYESVEQRNDCMSQLHWSDLSVFEPTHSVRAIKAHHPLEKESQGLAGIPGDRSENSRQIPEYLPRAGA
jgi:hypothetical protein